MKKNCYKGEYRPQSQQSLINTLSLEGLAPEDPPQVAQIRFKMNNIIELCLDCNGNWNQKYQSIGKAQLDILNQYTRMISEETSQAEYHRNISEKIIAKVKSAKNLLDSIEEEEESEIYSTQRNSSNRNISKRNTSKRSTSNTNYERQLLQQLKILRSQRIKLQQTLNKEIRNHNQTKRMLKEAQKQGTKNSTRNSSTIQRPQNRSQSDEIYQTRPNVAETYIRTKNHYKSYNTEASKQNAQQRTLKKNYSYQLKPKVQFGSDQYFYEKENREDSSAVTSKLGSKVKFDTVPVIYKGSSSSNFSSERPQTSIKTILDEKLQKEKLQRQFSSILID